jgi:hypothetical protein
MGGEWSKAVKKIFDKKYSNGRGKLVDAMKDPETKALHQEMLGKKPMNTTKMDKKMNNKMKKTQKYKKTKRGGQDSGSTTSGEPGTTGEGEENGPDTSGSAVTNKLGDPTRTTPATPATPGGRRSKKSRRSSKKNKNKKTRSFRKKPKCNY